MWIHRTLSAILILQFSVALSAHGQDELEDIQLQTARVNREAIMRALQARPIPAQRLLAAQDVRAFTPLRPFSLQSLARAKFVPGEQAKVIFMVERYRKETKTRTVNLTRMVAQEETEIINGKTIVVSMKQVPVTEQVEQEYSVRVPAGKKPVSVAWDQVEFYNLDGTKASQEMVAERLTTLQPVFLWKQSPKTAKVTPADELTREVVKPNTLMAVTSALSDNAVQLVPLP